MLSINTYSRISRVISWILCSMSFQLFINGRKIYKAMPTPLPVSKVYSGQQWCLDMLVSAGISSIWNYWSFMDLRLEWMSPGIVMTMEALCFIYCFMPALATSLWMEWWSVTGTQLCVDVCADPLQAVLAARARQDLIARACVECNDLRTSMKRACLMLFVVSCVFHFLSDDINTDEN